MLSAQPALSPADVTALLKSSARPFPAAAPAVPVCAAPQPVTGPQVDQSECSCTTTTCGAGMLDAGAAVRAALDMFAVTVVEFYNASLDHYFITWVPAEIAILDAGTVIKGWTRTGLSFKHLYLRAGRNVACVPPLHSAAARQFALLRPRHPGMQ